MATKETLLPEELVTAILHRVGEGVRIIDDTRLARIFDKAARSFGGGFSIFASHPQYRYSKALTDTFQALDHGGSIQRDNPASTYFAITPHTAGPYGSTLYGALDDAERQAVDAIAEEIKQLFGAENGSC
jgi:hypothetical protein